MRKVTVTQFRRNPEKIVRDCGFSPLAVNNAGGVAFFVIPPYLYKNYLSSVVDLLVANKFVFHSAVTPCLSIREIQALPVLPDSVRDTLSSRLGMGRLSRATKTLSRDELLIEVVIDNFRFAFRESAFDSFRRLNSSDKRAMCKAVIAWAYSREAYFMFPSGAEWHLCVGRENKLAAIIDCASVSDVVVIAALSEINEGYFGTRNYVELP